MANPSDTNVLVNDTFGDSYEVVKTVYNNLDTIKAVNENENLNTFIKGYDAKYSKLLDAVPAINNVANNMNSVTSAVNYSAQAKQAATDSSGSAKQAKTYAEETRVLAQEAKEANATLETISNDIKVVSDNIASVNYVADNMNQVNSVSALLSDADISSSIKTVKNNVNDLQKVASNITSIVKASHDAELLQAQSKALTDLMLQAKDDTESLQQELNRLDASKARLSRQMNEDVAQVQAEAKRQLDIITEATGVIENYLAKEKEYAQIAVNSSDDAIKTLIQCRDVLTIAEQSINKLTKKCLNALQQEYDRQLYKVRAEGDNQSLRITQVFADRVKDKSDEFASACDGIIDTKGQAFTKDLQNTVDTYKKEVSDIADNTNFNISKLESKVNDVIVDNAQINKDHVSIQSKIATIESLVHTQSSGDILFSYKDLSKSENAGSMVVGTTYMNMLDADKSYLQLNADNNQLADQTKKAVYVRYYIKSQSGSISYMDRKIDIDLSGYVPYDSTSGITLAYNSSYKATDSKGNVFPFFKVASDGTNFILSDPTHKVTYNGSELVNQESVSKVIKNTVPTVNPNDAILEVKDKLINTKFSLQYDLDTGILAVLGKDGSKVTQAYVPGAQRYLKEVSVVKNPSGLAAGTYLLLVFATVSGPETQYVEIPGNGTGSSNIIVSGTNIDANSLNPGEGVLIPATDLI